MAFTRTYSPRAAEAIRLLGKEIRVARRERHWTLDDLASRVGVSPPTMRKVENGDPTVALGVAFEAAAVLGLPLFGEEAGRRRIESGRLDDRLAVLPARVRPPKNDHRADF